MKIKCFRNLFRKKTEIIKIIEPKILVSEDQRKELEEDRRRIFSNPIVHGSIKRRRSFGKITSLPITRKHRDLENLSWLLDDKKK